MLSFIESIQPYYRIGAINNCLLFLADLSNIDKHRYLNLVRPRVKRYESVRFASGLSSRGHQALDRGAKIHPLHGWDESDRPEYVNRHYRTFVVFEERRYWGEATALPVEDLLKLILDHINSIIIPAFAKFVKNP